MCTFHLSINYPNSNLEQFEKSTHCKEVFTSGWGSKFFLIKVNCDECNGNRLQEQMMHKVCFIFLLHRRDEKHLCGVMRGLLSSSNRKHTWNRNAIFTSFLLYCFFFGVLIIAYYRNTAATTAIKAITHVASPICIQICMKRRGPYAHSNRNAMTEWLSEELGVYSPSYWLNDKKYQ